MLCGCMESSLVVACTVHFLVYACARALFPGAAGAVAVLLKYFSRTVLSVHRGARARDQSAESPAPRARETGHGACYVQDRADCHSFIASTTHTSGNSYLSYLKSCRLESRVVPYQACPTQPTTAHTQP